MRYPESVAAAPVRRDGQSTNGLPQNMEHAQPAARENPGWNGQDSAAVTVCILVAGAVWIIDLWTPRGWGEGVLYIFVVLASNLSPRKAITWAAAAASSGLTILGSIYSPEGAPMEVEWT